MTTTRRDNNLAVIMNEKSKMMQDCNDRLKWIGLDVILNQKRQQHDARLQGDARSKWVTRYNESKEQNCARLQGQAEIDKARRANETDEQNRARLQGQAQSDFSSK